MTELKTITGRFDTVLLSLPESLATPLEALPVFIKNSTYEIRLRAGGVVSLCGEHTFYISRQGEASSYIPQNPLIASQQELSETVRRITGNSLYARQEELEEGYLSMKGGNRAGICGAFVGGSLRSVYSINIRIANEIKGCAKDLLCQSKNGLLIVGPAGSGKTTLLRDLVRLLSIDGNRITVVDTRGEICGRNGEYTLDIGPNTDVITGLSKAKGCEIALRTMTPQYIAFDEVSNGRELSLIRESFFSGVKILTTAHASSMSEIKSRQVTSSLLDGSIGKIALIHGFGDIEFINCSEVKDFV